MQCVNRFKKYRSKILLMVQYCKMTSFTKVGFWLRANGIVEAIVMEVECLKKNIYLLDLIKDKEELKKMGINRITNRIKNYKVCFISVDLINETDDAYEINLNRIVMGDSSGKYHRIEQKARHKEFVDYRILHYLRNNIAESFTMLPHCKVNVNLVYPSIDDNVDIIKFCYRYSYSLNKDLASKLIEEFKIIGGIIWNQN